MTSTLVQIPEIDFAPFESGDMAAQRAVAQELYQACRDVGFFYLRNHGIPKELIDRSFTQAAEFFSLPLDLKDNLAWDETNRGYARTERQTLDPGKPGDLKETLDLGREPGVREPDDVPPPYYPSWMPKGQMNKWSPELHEFRQTALEFYAAAHETVCRVLRAFAIALDLPESFFADRHQRRNHTARFAHYPPLQTKPKLEQLRAGAHSDWGSITLLLQDNVGGLEIRTTDGNWIAATPVPDTVVVNIGDLMQRWTNDLFRSTKHRVAIPAEAVWNCDRYSIVFFGSPDYDVDIDCAPTCVSEGESPKHASITAGDYILDRIRTTY